LDEVGGSGIGADVGEEEVMNVVEELEFRIFASITSNSQVGLLNSILAAPRGLLLVFVWSISRS
jgi:hypothetical protein